MPTRLHWFNSGILSGYRLRDWRTPARRSTWRRFAPGWCWCRSSMARSRRARTELEAFEHLHPQAKGQLAGRTVAYAEELRTLLSAGKMAPLYGPRRMADLHRLADPKSHSAAGPDIAGQAWEPIKLGTPMAPRWITQKSTAPGVSARTPQAYTELLPGCGRRFAAGEQ